MFMGNLRSYPFAEFIMWPLNETNAAKNLPPVTVYSLATASKTHEKQ